MIGSNIDVVFVDLARAFDKVDQEVLAFKLRSLRIIGNLGSLPSNYYIFSYNSDLVTFSFEGFTLPYFKFLKNNLHSFYPMRKEVRHVILTVS